MPPPLFPGDLSLLHPLSAGVLASMASLVPCSGPGSLPSHSPLASLVLFPFLSAQLAACCPIKQLYFHSHSGIHGWHGLVFWSSLVKTSLSLKEIN